MTETMSSIGGYDELEATEPSRVFGQHFGNIWSGSTGRASPGKKKYSNPKTGPL